MDDLRRLLPLVRPCIINSTRVLSKIAMAVVERGLHCVSSGSHTRRLEAPDEVDMRGWLIQSITHTDEVVLRRAVRAASTAARTQSGTVSHCTVLWRSLGGEHDTTSSLAGGASQCRRRRYGVMETRLAHRSLRRASMADQKGGEL